MSYISSIIVDGKADTVADKARLLYLSLPSMGGWRHYYSTDQDDLEDWAERFLEKDSLMPGILNSRVHLKSPATIFECEIEGTYYKGAIYLNGGVVIDNGGGIELHIEEDEAQRLRYPAAGFHLNGKWYGDEEKT